MSKWINKDKAKFFVDKKKKEETKDNGGFVGNFALKYPNPQAGTQTKSKDYKIRFLPDSVSNFYKEYYYHFVQIGEKVKYVLCEKSFGESNFCPICAAVMKLYKGTESDKTKAGQLRKKQRFVANVLVQDDPRNSEAPEDEPLNGSVRLYEFPSTLEMKLKDELKDEEEGRGIKIFDPEDGVDFIIKVFSKPPDKSGKVWPDYSSSKFSVNLTSVDDVDNVMKRVYNLDEYLLKLKIPMEEQKTILEELMIFDDIQDDYNKHVLKQDVSKKNVEDVNIAFSDDKLGSKAFDAAEKKNINKKAEKETSNDDDDILNELKNMMD